MPAVVDEPVWEAARARLLVQEKALTRAMDALAARRRRLPMVAVANTYRFEGEHGPAALGDLFTGRRQLIVYHFTSVTCPGCARRIDDVGRLDHLHARRTSLAVTASEPYAALAALRERKGWTAPFFSAPAAFNIDMGATVGGTEQFGFSVFLRDDAGAVFRTYATTGRGVEPAGFRHLLDLTAYGRQEDWEDSPAGWPQSPTYGWGSERDA